MRNRDSWSWTLLALSINLAGCGGLYLLPTRSRPGVHSPGVGRDTLHSLEDRMASNGTYKMVVAKQAPNQLIADDGSVCVVDAATWEQTKLREKVKCVWSY